MVIKSVDSEIFTRGIEDIITKQELAERLKSGRKLRIKLGIDATAPDLHIGHAVSLWKIRAMQEYGHKAVIILGEFTTQIGDPTGRSKARPLLPKEVIKENSKQIKKQIEKILYTDKSVYELRKNSEWYEKMRTGKFLSLCAMINHAQLIKRDMFQERIKRGQDIAMAEILYPVLQGYDSVVIKSDLTIIGSDQLFNEHMGRFFQEKFGQAPQVLVSCKILPGLDGGEKMSKSLGNYIGLNDSPQDKFGKAMRLLDSLIIPYLEVYTSNVSRRQIKSWERKLKGGTNPMEAKLFFAQALVELYHGKKVAQEQRERFLNIFSKGQIIQDAPKISIAYGKYNIVDTLLKLGFAHSKSEARRLIRQRAVNVNGQVIADYKKKVNLNKGVLIKVGKRRFVQIR